MSTNQQRIIFLDTSTIESENFFEGRNINLLFHLANQNLIELKMTDIVYREIKKHLEERIIKSVNIYKRNKILLEDDGRILRNIDVLSDQFKRIDFKEIKRKAKSQILQKFEDVIHQNKIEIVGIDIANISEIVDDYFNTHPPFKEGQKKNEFPDAISINTIKVWCEKHSKKCLLIAEDKDFDNYINENIDCSFNLSTLLNLLFKENNDVQFEFITRVFEKVQDEIKQDLFYIRSINSKLESSVYDIFEKNHFVEDLEVEFDSIEDIEIDLAIINEIDETNFTYELDAQIIFTVYCYYTDYSEAYYDREDNFWIGEERKEGSRRFNANVLIYPNFNYNMENHNAEYIEVTDFEVRDIEEI